MIHCGHSQNSIHHFHSLIHGFWKQEKDCCLFVRDSETITHQRIQTQSLEVFSCSVVFRASLKYCLLICQASCFMMVGNVVRAMNCICFNLLAVVDQLLKWRLFCDPKDCSLLGSLCSWDFPDKNTGVGYHFLLQGIFPTQGSKPRLLDWQADSLPLSHQGSPFDLLVCIFSIK